MPTREEMIAEIRARNAKTPSREEMISAIRSGTHPGAKPIPVPEEPASPIESGLNAAKTAGQYAGRVLDYPGGIARTAIAQGVEALPGTNNIVNTQDWLDALSGKAPQSAEYMKRAGVTAGPSVDVPYLGNISTRDALGFGADVATDPLTALNKVGQGIEKAGSGIYKSAFKKVDEELAKKNAAPISKILQNEDFVGKATSAQAKSEALLNAAKSSRDELHTVVDAAGATVDPAKAFGPTMLELERTGQRNPGLKDLSDQLQENFQKYIDYGPVPISQASEWKTAMYASLPKNAYNKFDRLKGLGKKAERSVAYGLKNEIINSGNSISPGIGNAIDAQNEIMQSTLSSRNPLMKQVGRETTTNPITSVDMMLGGATAMATHDPVSTAAILAAKKIGDFSKTTAARTGVGLGLSKVGQGAQYLSDMPGWTAYPAAARAIYQSPWIKMKDKK